MNFIQGFYVIPALHSNVFGTTAKFGELSEKSKTFSRDPRTYTRPNADAYFQSFRVVDANGQRRTISTGVADRIVELGEWIYAQYELQQVPSQAQATLFANSIVAEHGVTNVSLGTISSGNTAAKRMPAWVKFNMTEGGEDFEVKVWLQNDNFFNEYEYSELFVIPPTPTLADLRLDLPGLINVLTSEDSRVSYVTQEDQITAQFPKTSTVSFPLNWHQLSDDQVTRVTTWMVICYGNAGNDTDAVKEAIRSYISANSPESDWDVIYPELYSDAEFSIVPFWNNIAAPATGGLDVLFTPTATLTQQLNLANTKMPASYVPNTTIGQTFLKDNARLVPTKYRQVATLVMGSPANANDVYDITDLYPDITCIPSTVADYSRMSTETRAFIEKLEEALDIAYDYTITTTLPSGFTRSVRNNRYYITFSLEGYQYLVMTKLSA